MMWEGREFKNIEVCKDATIQRIEENSEAVRLIWTANNWIDLAVRTNTNDL